LLMADRIPEIAWIQRVGFVISLMTPHEFLERFIGTTDIVFVVFVEALCFRLGIWAIPLARLIGDHLANRAFWDTGGSFPFSTALRLQVRIRSQRLLYNLLAFFRG